MTYITMTTGTWILHIYWHFSSEVLVEQSNLTVKSVCSQLIRLINGFLGWVWSHLGIVRRLKCVPKVLKELAFGESEKHVQNTLFMHSMGVASA